MVIYSDTKENFCSDTLKGLLVDKVESVYHKQTGRRVAHGEFNSWTNSLQFMNTVVSTDEIPNEAMVSIEYHLPSSSKRIDFILTGKDFSSRDIAIIIELKQWTETYKTDKPDIIETIFQGRRVETVHPSYQAWSYARILQDYNETVQEEHIKLMPCAFLHNHAEAGAVSDKIYSEAIANAPVFFKTDFIKLRQFISKNIATGDATNILLRIDNGRTKPSKHLANYVVSLLKGKPEFTLIDEQKICFEIARSLAKKARSTPRKQVLIVRGGPGTGKSVLAINLLSKLLSQGYNVRYTSKNAAPREVYKSKLKGNLGKSLKYIDLLFSGSGSFTASKPNSFDVLLCDEAHRLNEKSGLYRNLGKNQVFEIINAANLSVFFLDENQKVTIFDIGSEDEISKWATELNAEITIYDLASQFRCNGSDAFIAWIDQSLQIRETANQLLDESEYEFKVFSSPHELKKAIEIKNSKMKARLVAGYCWPWNSAKDTSKFDITFEEHKFKMKWNLKSHGSLWLEQSSTDEAGCIHTCQGLEMDYVGVIFGPDLIVRDGVVVTDATKRNSSDKSVHGYKKLFRHDEEKAKKIGDMIIKNTYRTLMTRGMKGCYIFSPDEETRRHFESALSR